MRPFAVDKDGKNLYVQVKFCGIHHLVVMTDGMPITFFGNEKTPYLLVQQAIDWHEKELKVTQGKSGNAQVLSKLKEILDAFDRNQLTIDG